jgi:uncharacterized LabA/DUF88 family protein
MAAKIGVYVDVANLDRNGGFGMRYEVLRAFACRGNAEAVRLNAYVTYDSARAGVDRSYRNGQFAFYAKLRDLGYKVIEKQVKWYVDEDGSRFGKANADLDLAVDALLQSRNLDRVLLATGDGDFAQVVKALQNKGCRVEVVAFKSVSGELRREADTYMSGYLIPNLLGIEGGSDRPKWGQVGSRVRGYCYYYNDDGYGFLRYLEEIADEALFADVRRTESPYKSAFFLRSELHGFSEGELSIRGQIFEFELAPQQRGKLEPSARDVRYIDTFG